MMLKENVDTLFSLRYPKTNLDEMDGVTFKHYRGTFDPKVRDPHWTGIVYLTDSDEHVFGLHEIYASCKDDLEEHFKISAQVASDVAEIAHFPITKELNFKYWVSIRRKKPGVTVVAIIAELENEEVCDVIYVPVCVREGNKTDR
jgi:hypothetical protein